MKRRSHSAWLTILICASVTAGAAAPDLVEVFSEAELALGKVDSYTAIFHKQERVEGELLPEERTELKFQKPFKVYMKWLPGPHKGRETIYVEGANGNRLKGHEGGLLGVINVNLEPSGDTAMKGNRHPITDVGLEKLVAKLATNARLGQTNGHLQTLDHGEEIVFGRKTRRLEGMFPPEQRGYYCRRAIVNVDEELKVPIKVQIFDAENQIVEIYGYENLRLNAGLTAADFDPKNPKYGF